MSDQNKILTSLNGYQIVDTGAREDIITIQSQIAGIGDAITDAAIDALFESNG